MFSLVTPSLFFSFLNKILIMIFLVKGNNNIKPIVSVTNPGNIRNIAAIAIEAPDIISKIGSLFL